MEWSDFLKSGIGAVVGFLLGQVVNVAKLIAESINRPRLRIEPADSDCKILSHWAEIDQGQYVPEEAFGFHVRNGGRSLAQDVQFQLVKIEKRDPDESGFSVLSDHTYELATYTDATGRRGATKVTILPKAAVLVSLAWWRIDRDGLFPAIERLPDYYEESYSYGAEYRFTVAAFGSNARHVSKVLTIRDPASRRKQEKRNSAADAKGLA